MSYKNMTVGMHSLYGVHALMHNSVLLYCSFFERAENTCKAAAASIDNGYTVCFDRRVSAITAKQQYVRLMEKVPNGRDRFTFVTMINKDIGKNYLLTDDEHLDEDFFNFLMCNYKLPLLEEWIPFIRDELISGGRIVEDTSNSYRARSRWQTSDTDVALPGIDLHGREVPLEKVRIFAAPNLTNENLSDVVTSLIESKVIRVSDVPSKPLNFEDMDQYITKYGPSLVENLENSITTLSPLNGELSGFAAKTKRLYPQQAACVNGMVALKRSGSKYGLMIEGMGCGKTLQGAAVVDSYFNDEWLKKHPGKTLKDMYLSKDKPSYRNILMAPSHLIEKWKEEILSEIPASKVTIIKELSQLIELRDKGSGRNGREWYLISKDFAKLGSQLSPVPVNVARKAAKGLICKDCATEGETVWISARGRSCERCGGRHAIKKELTGFGKMYGMVCPTCGELLLKNGQKYWDRGESAVLTPESFSSHGAGNEKCTLCGTRLWGADTRPAVSKGLKDLAPAKKWYKVSHWKNKQHKGRTSAYVLKGHESEYYMSKSVDINGVKKSTVEYGPRRFAPSLFIKKYLKGYFDFCILDEAHKYENMGTAQSNAAQALIKASDFTLCLTGTISNGRADCFFALLYMLDPARMRKRGYAFSDVMQFSKDYGAVETTYEAGYDFNGQRNQSSRGRQVSKPKIKPGISPKLFIDFLMDKSVFLDLSDLSKYMPSLNEKVVTCELPGEVLDSYNHSIKTLKAASRTHEGGLGVLSTMLQFGLAYPDKPYGFKNIVSPTVDDVILLKPAFFDMYAEGALLPKEEKLVEIVKGEIANDRNCFIYCAYTGSAELNITERLKSVVEDNCNLKGQVLVMHSQSPKATEREAFIRKKATEGIRVFICNMKLVETGLDFCFKVDGVSYNYPSIIFYQMTYELATMWQASRRHYRLNQTEECNTYYMCYENTLQSAAVQVMAEKQVAASAIQGKFSADGLAAMANGVDPRVKLAQMLAENDTSDRESLENMFDVMNASNNADEDDKYSGYQPPKTFYEIMDGAVIEEDVLSDSNDVTDDSGYKTFTFDFGDSSAVSNAEVSDNKGDDKSLGTAKKEPSSAVMPSFGMFTWQAAASYNEPVAKAEVKTTVSADPKKPVKKNKPKKKSSFIGGQTSLFDLMQDFAS